MLLRCGKRCLCSSSLTFNTGDVRVLILWCKRWENFYSLVQKMRVFLTLRARGV